MGCHKSRQSFCFFVDSSLRDHKLSLLVTVFHIVLVNVNHFLVQFDFQMVGHI